MGEVCTYAQALKQAEELDVVLIPYELAKGMEETKQIIAGIRPGQSVGIFIGPEGGFEEEEVALAMKTGANPVTLGKRILTNRDSRTYDAFGSDVPSGRVET